MQIQINPATRVQRPVRFRTITVPLYTGNNLCTVSLREALIVFALDLSSHDYSY